MDNFSQPMMYGQPMPMAPYNQMQMQPNFMQPQMRQMPQVNYTPTNPYRNAPSNTVKCIAVTSIDEAKASMIDLDGSLHVFTDTTNKRIYTKYIDLDGNPKFEIYELINQQQEQPKPVEIVKESMPAFLKESEFDDFYDSYKKEYDNLKGQLSKIEKTLQNITKEKAGK